MGASRYMAVSDHRDEQADRDYKAGEFVTASEYVRIGEPAAFKPADYPSEVDQLREEHGLDDDGEQAAADADALVGETLQDVDRAELDSKNVEELRALAADRDIEGRSGMNKQQLVDALRG